MNKYQKLYNSKLVTVEEALSKIKSNDVIATSNYGSEPIAILEQLHTIKDKVDNVTIWQDLGFWYYPFLEDNPNYLGKFDIMAVFYGPHSRKLHQTGRISYVPCHVRDMYKKGAELQKPSVFIGTASPMDDDGNVRLSISILIEKEEWEAADTVIVEVNQNMPRVYGDTAIPIDKIDYIVETDRPLIYFPSPELTNTDKTIGEYVSTLVHDGDCIQLGLGTIANACALSLMNKHDLGVHTEMISNSMMELAKAGVITGKKKTLHKNKMVGCFMMGSREFYEWADYNPSVLLKPGSYTNDVSIIRQNDNMVSINNALMIDFTGQANLESINGKHYGGTGGATDTAIGARMAKNGRSILTMNSTTKNGTVSTIQPFLPLGSTVSILRNDVDYVVTEYGIAPLWGRTIRERVKNLIAIAHPDFRKELKDAAIKNQIW